MAFRLGCAAAPSTIRLSAREALVALVVATAALGAFRRALAQVVAVWAAFRLNAHCYYLLQQYVQMPTASAGTMDLSPDESRGTINTETQGAPSNQREPREPRTPEGEPGAQEPTGT